MAAAAAGAGADAGVNEEDIVFGVAVDDRSWYASRLFRSTGVPGMNSPIKAESIAELAAAVAEGKAPDAASRTARKINEYWQSIDPVHYASEAVLAFRGLIRRGVAEANASVVFTPLHALVSRRLGYVNDEYATQAAVRCMTTDFHAEAARAVCLRILRSHELPTIPMPPVFRDTRVFINCPYFALRLNFKIPADFAAALLESPAGQKQCEIWADYGFACVEVPATGAVAKAYATYLTAKQAAVAAAFNDFPPYSEIALLVTPWL